MAAAKKTNDGFGAQSVAELLNNVDPATRERLLFELAKKDPVAWAKVQERLFTFEDLAKLDNEILRQLLGKAPQAKLALALRKSSPELKAAFFRNMTKASAEYLAAAIEELGPQRLSIVEAAQKEVLDIAKSLGR